MHILSNHAVANVTSKYQILISSVQSLPYLTTKKKKSLPYLTNHAQYVTYIKTNRTGDINTAKEKSAN